MSEGSRGDEHHHDIGAGIRVEEPPRMPPEDPIDVGGYTDHDTAFERAHRSAKAQYDRVWNAGFEQGKRAVQWKAEVKSTARDPHQHWSWGTLGLLIGFLIGLIIAGFLL